MGHSAGRYKKGCTTLKLGDCPTFFPLPSLTPGSEAGLTDQQRADMPNWVHKVCCPMIAGVWVAFVQECQQSMMHNPAIIVNTPAC